MKKNYKIMLALTAATLSFSAVAQVSIYSFSQLSGAYTAVTGGTVFGTTSLDDETFVNASAPNTSGNTGVGIPIGFNFTFNNIVYDRFGINNNGWIGFGQSALTPNAVEITNTGSNYNGISSPSSAPGALQQRVAALSRDLEGNGTSSSLRVETIGVSPNQICVIQWSNYKKYGGNGTGDDFSFQIRLYETTNRVEVVYGTFVNNANAGAGEVGLRGASNADFNNRTVDATNPWNASIPGTINTAAVNYNNGGLVPNTGQIYRWDGPLPCSGTPATNSVTSNLSLVCPAGSASLGLVNSYTNTGINYQWYVSTSSALGPFVIVPSATASVYNPGNITVNSWYNAVITCASISASTAATAYNVMVAATTTSNIPYFEGFEGVTQNDRLPNCSWAISNSLTCQTYTSSNTNSRIARTGTNFASFFYNPGATNYFYTNGIQLTAGITYSASLWYISEHIGYNNWTDLSILYGTAQTPTGLVSIASTNGPAISNIYKSLSNTFSVPTTGLYYITVRGTGNTSSFAQWLTWDDLEITIPCSVNAPTVSLITNTTSICIGNQVVLNASGADTYSWSTGAVTSAITENPLVSTVYTIVGTSSLSGCSSMLTQMITVNPAPSVFIYANNTAICSGQTTNLTALGGANSYTWSNGALTSAVAVSPVVNSTYSVIGTNIFGCSSSAVQAITVNPLPIVGISTSAPINICKGETSTLTATGGVTYLWTSNTSAVVLLGSAVDVSPASTSIYTVTVTNANGCSAKATIVQNVSECLGLKTNSVNSAKVYPNPTAGEFTVELNNTSEKTVEVVDVTGRIISSSTSSQEVVNVNISNLANGVYYLKIKSNTSFEVIKVVKN
jgi:hypothetical protein